MCDLRFVFFKFSCAVAVVMLPAESANAITGKSGSQSQVETKTLFWGISSWLGALQRRVKDGRDASWDGLGGSASESSKAARYNSMWFLVKSSTIKSTRNEGP
jgi:hypothetical protein